MSELAVRLHGVNDDGLPPEWPAEVKELGADDATPDGWLPMTTAELVLYKSLHRAAFKASRQTDPVKLAKAKTEAFSNVDRRTDALIARGMTFGGLTFSLSANARETASDEYASRGNPAIYPVEKNTIDDMASIQLGDADDLGAFYSTGRMTVYSHIKSANEIKRLVRAALTVDDVKAVEDTR